MGIPEIFSTNSPPYEALLFQTDDSERSEPMKFMFTQKLSVSIVSIVGIKTIIRWIELGRSIIEIFWISKR